MIDSSRRSAIEARMPFWDAAVTWLRSARFGVIFVLAALLFAAASCHHSSEPLPTLGQVGAFSLVDQDGKGVTAETLRGKVWVAAFFFTHCPTICPRITRRVRALQIEANGHAPPIWFVSFSVDPDNDTPPVLLAYAKQYSADLRSWSFLTGDLAVVKSTVIDGFKLALDGKPDPTAENGGIIHGSHLVLVDPTLAIRGYYRTDDDAEMKRLLDDATRL
jgi:protein SCO1/2